MRAPRAGRPTPELAGDRPEERWAPTRELDTPPFFFSTVGTHEFILDFGGYMSEVAHGSGTMVQCLVIMFLSFSSAPLLCPRPLSRYISLFSHSGTGDVDVIMCIFLSTRYRSQRRFAVRITAIVQETTGKVALLQALRSSNARQLHSVCLRQDEPLHTCTPGVGEHTLYCTDPDSFESTSGMSSWRVLTTALEHSR